MGNNTLPAGFVLHGSSQTYRIEKVLGQGSFGITYLATTNVKVTGALGNIETTIQVAVKEFFIREVNGREGSTVTTGSQGGLYEKYKEKFIRESRNLSPLDHPHIVKVLEAFEANNTAYYAMEYLEGGSLDNFIGQKGCLPEAECIAYTKQIGSALSYMHAHKMLHLDLKPGNIMLRKNGDAVLIDFGLSKQYDKEGKPETSTTVGGGTPGYAPLEQGNYHDGKGFPVTMDVYALGGTMYKMLTGKCPPEASDILNDGFPSDLLRNYRLSDSLITCVGKAMAPMKKDRPQSVDEFLRSLPSDGISVEDEVTGIEKEPIAVVYGGPPIEEYALGRTTFWKRVRPFLFGISGVLLCLLVFWWVGLFDRNSQSFDSGEMLLGEDSMAVAETVANVMEETRDSFENIIAAPAGNNVIDDSTAVVQEAETREERFQKAMELQGKAREKALLQLTNEGYADTYFPLAQYYFSTHQDGQTDKWLAKSLHTVDYVNAIEIIQKKLDAQDFSLELTMRELAKVPWSDGESRYLLLAKWHLGRNEDQQADKYLRMAIAMGGDKQETRKIEQILRERGFYD